VAYLKFSRDKRGYEHFCLVQPANKGKGRPRVLYWFRTPPNLRIGRVPFDPEVRRALEAHNPDVAFDWTRIVQTPIPPPVSVERWRERRRVERERRAADGPEAVTSAEEAGAEGAELTVPDEAAGNTGATPPEDARLMGSPARPDELSGPSVPIRAGAASAERPRRRRRRRKRKGRSEATEPPGTIQDPGESEGDNS
jgi:hypothetical protein